MRDEIARSGGEFRASRSVAPRGAIGAVILQALVLLHRRLDRGVLRCVAGQAVGGPAEQLADVAPEHGDDADGRHRDERYDEQVLGHALAGLGVQLADELVHGACSLPRGRGLRGPPARLADALPLSSAAAGAGRGQDGGTAAVAQPGRKRLAQLTTELGGFIAGAPNCCALSWDGSDRPLVLAAAGAVEAVLGASAVDLFGRPAGQLFVRGGRGARRPAPAPAPPAAGAPPPELP